MNTRILYKSMARLVAYVAIGVLVAVIGEVQYSVFIRGDVANLIGSMGFNVLYLTGAAGVAWPIFRTLGKRPLTILLVTALAGFAGLTIEWFVIGNSPWGNPDASNMGMFAYWACMVVVPVAFLDSDHHTSRLRRNILIYGVVYMLLALAAQLIPNADLRYAYHIWSVIFGYLGLLIMTVVGLVRGWRLQPNLTAPSTA